MNKSDMAYFAQHESGSDRSDLYLNELDELDLDLYFDESYDEILDDPLLDDEMYFSEE